MSNDKVTSLRPVAREPNQGAIEILEYALEMAREGKLQEMVIVANIVDDGHFWRATDYADAWRILGALEMAKAFVNKTVDDGVEKL